MNVSRRSHMDDNKRKALSAALGQIEHQFGKGAVMRMGDTRGPPVISTSSRQVRWHWMSHWASAGCRGAG